ncbi:MAG: hypothetical protein AB9846_11465 [Tenuifilaceae bacterium]
MQQEDYLKRQIDQLGRVLGKILADLLGLKTQGQAGQVIEVTNLALKDELDLNIDDLIALPEEEFISTLVVGKKLNEMHLEKLAEILFLIAEDSKYQEKENKKSKELYLRAFLIYDHLNRTSSTYSFDRQYKIEEIRKILNDPSA